MAHTITLSPTQQKLVEQKVHSGAYASESEVISTSLWLLEERDRFYQFRLEELRNEIQKGINSGPPIPAEKVFRQLEKKLARRTASQA